jgi:hypothetical protein
MNCNYKDKQGSTATDHTNQTTDLEDIMKSTTTINGKTTVDVTEEVMSFSLKVGAVLSALVGIWGFACLLAGLTNFGPIEMLKGYFTAITGF